MVTERVAVSGFKVATILYKTVNDVILPGTGVEVAHFWESLIKVLKEFGPENARLLKKRDELQKEIDEWYRKKKSSSGGNIQLSPEFVKEEIQFLSKIGYIQGDISKDPGVSCTTTNVDDEIAHVPGPQLVVPVDNARFVLNAINARWGSLLNAVYGSDIFGKNTSKGFDATRGGKVLDFAFAQLDSYLPLQGSSWRKVHGIWVENVSGITDMQLVLVDKDQKRTTLIDSSQFKGYNGSKNEGQILFCHHGLHIIVDIDPQAPFAKLNDAKIADVILESALTAIMDCEDSVAAVDAEDKSVVYRNWTGLMKGTLETTVQQGDKKFVRKMNEDKTFRAPNGDALSLSGRVLALVRNVGMHLLSDAIIDENGQPVAETIIDAVVTTVAALHDLRRSAQLCNSRRGSVYIVKPKMHGPEEVDYNCRMFTRVESYLGIAKNTIKMGIMDEERRTSINLAECLRAASERVVFINTGFLDRTGDEIHTCMHGGPVKFKSSIKKAPWLDAYEQLNTLTGIQGNLLERAQIGKGMWAEPDSMKAMLEQKINHPKAAANTAWVPSPIAGTLHALHYHMVDVKAEQKKLSTQPFAAKLPLQDRLLLPPLASPEDIKSFTPDAIEKELENNAQGILGYMVRWIDLGVGCSKVPDINGVGLMEDRATLRISSQHVGNWLLHGIITKEHMEATFRKMAAVVDEQNKGDPKYQPMSKDFASSIAFQTALHMCLQATVEPNGYTEGTLTEARRRVKEKHVGSNL